MAQPTVILTYSGGGSSSSRTLEVSPEVGLAGFRQTAEKHLGLQPDSFEIRDDYGPLDTDLGLQRCLADTTDGVCCLEVRVHPLWERVQKLDAELQELTSRDSAAALAAERAEAIAEARAAAQEERILEKVRAEICQVYESLQVATQGSTSSLASLVQSVAMEQMDVRKKVNELEESCNRANIEVHSEASESSDLQGVRSRLRDAEESIRNLQAEARRLEEKCHKQDVSIVKSPSQPPHGREAWKIDLGTEELTTGATYSMKSYSQRRAGRGLDANQCAGSPTITPMAWGTAARQLDRAGSGCRSLPQL